MDALFSCQITGFLLATKQWNRTESENGVPFVLTHRLQELLLLFLFRCCCCCCLHLCVSLKMNWCCDLIQLRGRSVILWRDPAYAHHTH